FRFDVQQTLPARAITTQYRESDWDFVTRIDILAQQKIVLQAGRTSITLEGGNITFACPGTFTVKAGQHPFMGGEVAPLKLEKLPDTRLKRPESFSQKITIKGLTPNPFTFSENLTSDVLNNNGSRVELSASERLHQFSRFYTDKKEEDLTVFVKEGNWQFDEALDDDLEFDEES
ncbi:DUF2345 domain-containing protein, partial [Xanthomonas oryzae]|uniref:DUF2345 domain-containing protein n=1 Tax=Xanthomonas oryzae TaxID=347 RepID=UPI00215BA061